MADQYTPEEIQEIFDRYNDSIRRNIPVSEALAKEMADATKGVKNYTNQLNHSLGQLGQASKQAAQDIGSGAKGTSVFNSAIEGAGNTTQILVSRFGALGKVAGAVIGGLTQFIIAVNKQSDTLYNSFQQLSRSGTIGSQGMDDVFQSMRRMGYTINELDKMTSVLTENSKSFAQFSGTAATGQKQLANMVMGLEDSRTQLFNLGLAVDDIAQAAAGYTRQMGRQGRIQDATSAGALAYIREMETLTRLTGLQRKELEDQREAAEDIDTFFAALMDMNPEAAKESFAVFNQLMAVDPTGKKARAFATSINGIIGSSEEQMQALFSTNFQLLDFAQSVKNGTMTAAEFMQATSDATRGNIELQKNLAKIGISDLFGGLKNNVLLANKGLIPFARQLGLSEKEIAELEAGVNAATDAQSKTRDLQIKTSQNIQDFINTGINPVTKAMKILANAVEYLTNLLPGSGRAKARYEREQQEQASAAAAKVTGGILDKIIQAESGGKNIANQSGAGGKPTTTAFGVAQMTKGTFEGLAKQATPGSALHGKTFEDMKSDVGLQREALSQLTTQNQTALAKAGIAVSDASTYLAHFLGSRGAMKVLQANDRTPIEAVVDGRAIMSNPSVFKNIATAGDLKAWAERKMGGPGVSGAFGFRGTVSGPMSGYSPNITMHGTEELSIKPAGSSSTNPNSSASEGTMTKLVERMDDLIAISKNQLGVNEKMLKYAQ